MDETKYHVVFRHDRQLDDIIIVGIFTLRQDGELMAFDLKLNGHSKVVRLELSLNAIKQYLMHESVGKLSDVLVRLEQLHEDLGGTAMRNKEDWLTA